MKSSRLRLQEIIKDKFLRVEKITENTMLFFTYREEYREVKHHMETLGWTLGHVGKCPDLVQVNKDIMQDWGLMGTFNRIEHIQDMQKERGRQEKLREGHARFIQLCLDNEKENKETASDGGGNYSKRGNVCQMV